MSVFDKVKRVGVERESKRLVALEGASGTGKTKQYETLVKGWPEVGLEGWNVLYVSAERKPGTIAHLGPPEFVVENLDFPMNLSEKQAMLAEGSSDFMALFEGLRKEEHGYDAIYTDSVTRYAEKLISYLLDRDKADMRAAYGKFGKKMRAFLDTLASCASGATAKQPVHVITTWIVEVGKDWQGRRSFMPMIDGNMVADRVNQYFDDVLFMACDEDLTTRKKSYLMHTSGTQEFSAKISSNVELPPVIENPNLFKAMSILSGKVRKEGEKWVKVE